MPSSQRSLPCPPLHHAGMCTLIHTACGEWLPLSGHPLHTPPLWSHQSIGEPQGVSFLSPSQRGAPGEQGPCRIPVFLLAQSRNLVKICGTNACSAGPTEACVQEVSTPQSIRSAVHSPVGCGMYHLHGHCQGPSAKLALKLPKCSLS